MSNIVKKVTRTIEIQQLEIDWLALAAAVESKVMAKLKDDLEFYKAPNERNMRAMLICDAGDGVDVCDKLAQGVWKEVDKKLWSMDTAARDYLYDFIEQVAGAEFFKLVNKS